MKKCKLFVLIFIAIVILGLNSCTSQQKNTMKVTKVLDIQAKLGEGALWDNNGKFLYWVDIQQGLLHIYNPATHQNKTIDCGKKIGTVVPVTPEKVLVALEDGIYSLHTTTEELTFIVNPPENDQNKRFNDGKCDPAGRFWVGTIGKKHTAALYCLYPDGQLEKKLDSVTISNGITWSKDKKKMYYIDTPTREVKEFDYDNKTGKIRFSRVAVTVPEEMGHPDGSTMDKDGNLWIALWGGACVSCWNVETGELLRKIDVPAKNVTSCAFGGVDLKTLYITTAGGGLSEEDKKKYPDSGCLFQVKTETKGVKSYYFKGLK